MAKLADGNIADDSQIYWDQTTTQDTWTTEINPAAGETKRYLRGSYCH